MAPSVKLTGTDISIVASISFLFDAKIKQLKKGHGPHFSKAGKI
jgi:hypothetical protein